MNKYRDAMDHVHFSENIKDSIVDYVLEESKGKNRDACKKKVFVFCSSALLAVCIVILICFKQISYKKISPQYDELSLSWEKKEIQLKNEEEIMEFLVFRRYGEAVI